jgi:hypothetical protein
MKQAQNKQEVFGVEKKLNTDFKMQEPKRKQTQRKELNKHQTTNTHKSISLVFIFSSFFFLSVQNKERSFTC